LAALNDLDIMSCDIGNAYLNAPCREKIWFVAGPEFGSRQGQVIKIVRALCGLKSSGASWRYTLQKTICEDLNFESTIADPDVYRRHAVKKCGTEYWELLLVYVDDILVISSDPRSVLNKLRQHYEFSTNVSKVTIPGDDSGHEYWSISSRTYIQNAVQNIKEMLKDEGGLKGTAKTPPPSN
jgi:hypothetical protein